MTAICFKPMKNLYRTIIIMSQPHRFIAYLRSASRHHLTVPRHRLSTLGRRAFSVAGPTVWYSLPDSLRDPALSSDRFRQLLYEDELISTLPLSTHSAVENAS